MELEEHPLGQADQVVVVLVIQDRVEDLQHLELLTQEEEAVEHLLLATRLEMEEAVLLF